MKLDQLPKIVRDRLNALARFDDMPPDMTALLRAEAKALSDVIDEMIKPPEQPAGESDSELEQHFVEQGWRPPAGKTLIEVFANEDALAEIARLRELIDNQPHAKGCHFVLGQRDRKCNCWKSEAASARCSFETTKSV